MTDTTKKTKNSIRRGLSLSFVKNLVALVFSFGSVMIISRLLTPAEVGVFSVAAGLVALIQMLRDFGVSEFLVQEPVLDEAKVRTVFTVNLIIAWCLAGFLFLGSGAIGSFYGDPGVAQVLRVLSIVLVLLPFGAIATTRMRRELEFGKLTKIGIAVAVIRSTTAVALAYLGFSYMSMAWSALAGTVVMIAACMLWGWKYRVTGLSLVHWRRVVHFGSYRTISDIATELGTQSPNLVVGKMLGMTATGLYSRGYGVVNMYATNVFGAIQSVAFPAFAREHRETARAPELFLKSLVYMTGVSWPFFACGIILAFPLINLFFGDQWNSAVPLMRWLCAAALIWTLVSQCNSFFVALGRVRMVTRIEVQYQLARVGITIIAAFHSLEAVAAAQILVYALGTALYYRQLGAYNALAVRTVAKALVPSAAVTLAACVVPTILLLWPRFAAQHMFVALFVSLVGGGAGWLLAVFLVQHPLVEEIKRVGARIPGNRFLLRS